MNTRALQQYIYTHIPIAKAMGVEVVAATTESVTLSAPLAPNVNHQGTVFGGSASAVALLAAWALLHVRLDDAGVPGAIVVKRNVMSYERPITADFIATSTIDDAATWRKFVEALQHRGRARISITTKLYCNDEKVAQLDGEFVASS